MNKLQWRLLMPIALLHGGLKLPVAGAQDQHYRAQARAATRDLLQHFWVNKAGGGHIVNTWHGYATGPSQAPLPDARGALWERATCYLALDSFYRLTADPNIKQKLSADWQWTKAAYPADKLEACGADSGTNWAQDDAGWSALMYLAAYRDTADPAALGRARGLVNHAFKRWEDEKLGDLWYDDKRAIKSLYQVSLVLASLELYQLTGERSFYDHAFACYSWMEQHLRRDDGLYWCDYNEAGPVGRDRPNDIKEAGSVTYLGGDMGMAVAHARLYRITGQEVYRARAERTAEAILQRLTGPDGVYLDDRDAATEGIFAGDWAREVLTLPGVAAAHRLALQHTADSIYAHARTPDGYYGGSWAGPATGAASVWWSKGVKPQQLMTSANAVSVIVAAAFLEGH